MKNLIVGLVAVLVLVGCYSEEDLAYSGTGYDMYSKKVDGEWHYWLFPEEDVVSAFYEEFKNEDNIMIGAPKYAIKGTSNMKKRLEAMSAGDFIVWFDVDNKIKNIRYPQPPAEVRNELKKLCDSKKVILRMGR